MSHPSDPAAGTRAAMRQHLLAERRRFAGDAASAAASAALSRHVIDVLKRLEPQCLGLYWPIRSEFSASVAIAAEPALTGITLALPYTRREPRTMEYRVWDGHAPPGNRDECGIPAPDGPVVVPDVLLVPCVGYTRDGFRLGYGGGYFDRWLAAHPHATTVGLAWSSCEIDAAAFAPEAHDLALSLIVTEAGVV